MRAAPYGVVARVDEILLDGWQVSFD